MFTWNDKIWESIRGQVDRLPHAVLIQGPAGVGKLALAEQLATRLVCEAPTSDGAACGRCDGCRWAASGNHPDLRRIEPDAHAVQRSEADDNAPRTERGTRGAKPSLEIKIDQVRELADFLYLGSHRGRRRVAIVHPAEAMNVHAANALLKGLEEPPPGASFLLVSHQPARLLPTIRSRCVVVAVPRPPEQTALDWLAAQGQSTDAARWLAFAGGSPRAAYEYAVGERGVLATPILAAIARGGPESIPEASNRETLEAMAEVLQKHAIDQLTDSLAGRRIYGTQALAGKGSASARAWSTFARSMGRARSLTSHPVNPRLFSAELLVRFKELLK
jgi:DNA polymerase III subunit delta'